MVFELNRFKSKLDSYGGPARSNMFMVEMYGMNSSYLDDETIRFFCRSVTVPGINLNLFDYNPRNFGMSEAMPTNISSEMLNGVFIMDSDHRVMSFFHEWMQKIINYNTFNGMESTNSLNNEQLPYEINYKTDYEVNMTIKQFSLEAENTYHCTLTGVYPTQISPTNLSWDSGELMSLSVNFSYNKIGFSGMMPNTGRIGGSSLTDYFARFGANMVTQEIVNDTVRGNRDLWGSRPDTSQSFR